MSGGGDIVTPALHSFRREVHTMEPPRFTTNRFKEDAVVLSDSKECNWYNCDNVGQAALKAANILASELEELKKKVK